jgi:hypothetical protein
MKNKEMNRLMKKEAIGYKQDYYYKRFGKCNPKNCAGACCRYNVFKQYCCASSYHVNVKTPSTGVYIETVKCKNYDLVIGLHNCKYLTKNCRCKLHNKKNQPTVCEKFPMSPRDGVYKYVKKYCGFYFKKIKIKKQKRRK